VAWAVHQVIVEQFIASLAQSPTGLIIDMAFIQRLTQNQLD
jgi:hypothetical protein